MLSKPYDTIRIILLIGFKNGADNRKWNCVKNLWILSWKPTWEFLKTCFFNWSRDRISLQHSRCLKGTTWKLAKMDLTIWFEHIILFDAQWGWLESKGTNGRLEMSGRPSGSRRPHFFFTILFMLCPCFSRERKICPNTIQKTLLPCVPTLFF